MGALQKYLVLLALVSACYAVLCPPLLKVCAIKKVALHSLLGTILQTNNTFLNQLLNKVSTVAPPSAVPVVHIPIRPLVPVALTPSSHTSEMGPFTPGSGLPASPAPGMIPAAPASGMMPAAPTAGMMAGASHMEMMGGAPAADMMPAAPPAEMMAGASNMEMMAGAPPADMMPVAPAMEMMMT